NRRRLNRRLLACQKKATRTCRLIQARGHVHLQRWLELAGNHRHDRRLYVRVDRFDSAIAEGSVRVCLVRGIWRGWCYSLCLDESDAATIMSDMLCLSCGSIKLLRIKGMDLYQA